MFLTIVKLKNVVKNVKPPVNRKLTGTTERIPGMVTAFLTSDKDLVQSILRLCLCMCVSGRTVNTSRALREARIVANQNGTAGENHVGVCKNWWPATLINGMLGADNRPPRYGPSTKPMPNIAPIRPKLRVRVLGVLMSLMIARPMAMLPPVMPSIARLKNRSGMFF